MSSPQVLLETDLRQWPLRRGKVRDLYDLGEQLLLVATDRISAFDWVLSTGIPDKGRVLTQLSQFWFDKLDVPNHRLPGDAESLPGLTPQERSILKNRSMIVRKTDVIPFECVVRGYLSGSAWKEYRQSGSVCGISLPAGLVESQELPEPIFTPATKSVSGHDQNVPLKVMCDSVGSDLTNQLRDASLRIYTVAAEYAKGRGVLLADTKFEWGLRDGAVLLIDEVLTPDSSRYWPADRYQPGCSPPSFDKQFVRDWLEACGWDKNSPPPELPRDIVERTRERYLEALTRLTGQTLHNG